ncbi:hypothetical protein [Halomarina litorea]|uniref:hypothetical protein n=1 Tax=Halomarina litorea TaxID=2961595 RepID=UPI0020C3C2BB|nr:hypothetical protein [Halomarina sp. BCD28]
MGRGIAAELGAAGATVYVTGQSVAGATTRAELGGTVGETAALVTDRGGEGIAVQCDHTDDGQVRDLFDRVENESERLDASSTTSGAATRATTRRSTPPSGSNPPPGSTGCWTRGSGRTTSRVGSPSRSSPREASS